MEAAVDDAIIVGNDRDIVAIPSLSRITAYCVGEIQFECYPVSDRP